VREELLPERRREALLHVDLGACAIARVDAPVPQLAVAGALRSGQQFTVGHAQQAVVPLPHAFAAQADRDQLKRPVQARVISGRLALCGGDRQRTFRQRHRQPEALAGQLAVEVQLAGNCPEHLVRLVAQSFAILGIRGQRLQGARFPVDPDRLALFRGGHCIDALDHLLPTAGALVGSQRSAYFPPEHVVGPFVVCELRCLGGVGGQPFGALELFRRAARQAHRRLLCRGGPRPRGQVVRQCPLPAFAQGHCSGIRIGGSQLDQRQCRQFGTDASVGPRHVRQIACRCIQEHLDGTVCLRLKEGDSLRHCARPVEIHGDTRLAPCVSRSQDLGRQQRAGEQRTSVVSVALGKPGVACGISHIMTRQVLGEQRVAGHFAIVTHAESRKVGAEVHPVAPASEFEQPVVAQPVFDIGAAPAAVEGVQIGLLQGAQSDVDVPVGHPHCQRVLRRCRRIAQGSQPRAVALAVGVASFEHRIGRRSRGCACRCLGLGAGQP